MFSFIPVEELFSFFPALLLFLLSSLLSCSSLFLLNPQFTSVIEAPHLTFGMTEEARMSVREKECCS